MSDSMGHTAHLTSAEVACVKRLAELSEKGVVLYQPNFERDPEKALGLPDESRAAILATMELIGAIDEAQHPSGLRFYLFNVSARAVQIAREIREKEAAKPEPSDIVSEMKDTVRRHPILAWILIGFFALTTIAAFAASVLTIIDKVIDLRKKLGN